MAIFRVNSSNSPFNISVNGLGTILKTQEENFVLCTGSVTVNLPNIQSSKLSSNVKFYFIQLTSGTITVNTTGSDKFTGNVNTANIAGVNSSFYCQSVSDGFWYCNIGSTSSGGGGGEETILLGTVNYNQLNNANADPQVIFPFSVSKPEGKYITGIIYDFIQPFDTPTTAQRIENISVFITNTSQGFIGNSVNQLILDGKIPVKLKSTFLGNILPFSQLPLSLFFDFDSGSNNPKDFVSGEVYVYATFKNFEV